MSVLRPWLLKGYKTAELEDVKVALLFELKYIHPDCGTEHGRCVVALANDHLGHGFTGVWQAQGVFTLMQQKHVDKDNRISDRSMIVGSTWRCSTFPYVKSRARKHSEHFSAGVRRGGWRHILSDYLLGMFFKLDQGLCAQVSLPFTYLGSPLPGSSNSFDFV